MRSIQISNETYEKIKHLLTARDFDITELDDLIGKKFFFRTITYHLVGRVTKRFGNFLMLEHASWVADSGRFSNAIAEGTLDEVEPVGIAYLNMDSLTDFFPWVHELPSEQK